VSKPLVIALRGPLGSGKTAAAKYLATKYDFRVVSFATPLKEAAKKITPDGRIDKKRDRALLQFLGTEYFRGIDSEHWVKQFMATAESFVEHGLSVVTDDCRFPNEQAAVRKLGGFEVYINTPADKIGSLLLARDGEIAKGISGHASEAMNDPSDPSIDVVIDNQFDIGQLYFELDHMLIDLRKIAAERENSSALSSEQTG